VGLKLKIFGPPFDDKLVYTFHKYWVPVKVDAIQPYLDFRTKYNVRSGWANPARTPTSGSIHLESCWRQRYRLVLLAIQEAGCDLMHRFNKRPEDWDAIIAFADGPRTTFEEVRSTVLRKRRWKRP